VGNCAEDGGGVDAPSSSRSPRSERVSIIARSVACRKRIRFRPAAPRASSSCWDAWEPGQPGIPAPRRWCCVAWLPRKGRAGVDPPGGRGGHLIRCARESELREGYDRAKGTLRFPVDTVPEEAPIRRLTKLRQQRDAESVLDGLSPSPSSDERTSRRSCAWSASRRPDRTKRGPPPCLLQWQR
jgi:hypothetical protein